MGLTEVLWISERPELPAYSIFDARIGIEKDRWSIAAFCKNLANKIVMDGLYTWNPTSSGSGVQNAALYTPRTIGVELKATFR